MAKDATVLAVYEDWPGGAGNALGTLYAYQKAAALAESKGYDMAGKLKAGEVRERIIHIVLVLLDGSQVQKKIWRHA